MTTTSTGEHARLHRAVNQLNNVERLIAGLPVKAYTNERRPQFEHVIELIKQARAILTSQQSHTNKP